MRVSASILKYKIEERPVKRWEGVSMRVSASILKYLMVLLSVVSNGTVSMRVSASILKYQTNPIMRNGNFMFQCALAQVF